METYYALGKSIVVIAIAAQSFLVLIQGRAYVRHRKRCFALLFAGAFLGLIYGVLAGLPMFVPFSLPTHLLLMRIDLALLCVGASLGILGMVLLLRSYKHLSHLEDLA